MLSTYTYIYIYIYICIHILYTHQVDIDWAGYTVFLSHPAYSGRTGLKEEVLRRAREEESPGGG